MKHSIKLIALAAMLMATTTASAEEFTLDGLKYTTTGLIATVVGPASTCSGILKIPSSAKSPATGFNFMVTKVGDYAFQKCTEITSVMLSETIDSIGDYAFSECSRMQSASLANTSYIGEGTFNATPKLTYMLIPTKIKSIGDRAFQNSGLKDIFIMEGLTHINSYTFWGCDSLKSIHLPSSLRVISEYAFGCKSLTSITLPSQLEQIWSSAFTECPNLNTICCTSKTPTTIKTNSVNPPDSYFTGTISNRLVWVPVGCRSAYASDTYWGKFGYVMEMGGTPVGDSNSDGIVDVTDVTALMKKILQ